MTQFYEACMYGWWDVAERILELGLNPNCPEQIESGIDPPLNLALRHGRTEMLDLLLRHGANPNLANKSGTTALHEICRRPCFAYDMATVFFEICRERQLWLLLDARDNEGWTPLQLALTVAKDCDLVELLLARGANPILADPDGRTSLQFVVSTYIDYKESATIEVLNRLQELARSMLLRGADPTLANDEGETSLHLVAKEDRQLSVEFFYDVLISISREAITISPEWIDARDKSGCTPLHLACRSLTGPVENYQAWVPEWLLTVGADPNALNEHSETPLHYLSRHEGNLSLMERLFDICDQKNRDAWLDVQDRWGDTPLHLAARGGHRAMTQLLLERDTADPTVQNAKRSTPLHEASRIDKDSFLLDFLATCRDVGRSVQATVNVQDKNGDAPLHLALELSILNHEATVPELLRLGADPNLANNEGSSPLHCICKRHDIDNVVQIFFALCDELQRAVHLDARDNAGNTPLHLALANTDEDTAEILLRRGADPTLVNARGETPLHVICSECEIYSLSQDTNLASIFFRVNDELRRHPIEIDARDHKGQTPLQLAVSNLMPNTVDILLDRGADMSNFVLQFEKDLCDRHEPPGSLSIEFKWKIAISALTLIERLERREYVLDRSDAMTIMRYIVELGLLRITPNPVTSLLQDEHFTKEAQTIMVKNDDSTTLHDLLKLPLKEAAKRFTCLDYFELVRDENKLRKLADGNRVTCLAHLFKVMSTRFFGDWALEPFIILIHVRLPIPCCEMIIENLHHEDLFNICLALEG
ncbi:hypothetical protein TKK_0013209 [Trichogramma kaykai]